MVESIENLEAGLENEGSISEVDQEWVQYSLEKDIVNPQEGNASVYDKLSQIHEDLGEDADVKAATAEVRAKLDDLKASLS